MKKGIYPIDVSLHIWFMFGQASGRFLFFGEMFHAVTARSDT